MYSVALLPGDGVGIEVIAEARKAVDALGVEIAWTEFPWGAAHHAEHGAMMPPDWAEMLRAHDAILLGACGWPTLPDHVTVWGMTLLIRQTLDLWANVRPARLLPGIPTPLAGRGPADLDMLFLRENTEGEYAGVGGRSHRGLPLEVALETSVFTRAGTERVVRYGFELAAGRRGVLISATKSNASRFGYVLWDEIVEEVSADFPDIRVERMLVDALAARVVRDPGSIDVVVASNLLGTCSPTSRPPSAAASGWPQAPTSLPEALGLRCSNPFTALPRTSPARGLRTRSPRSGARHSCSSTLGTSRRPASSLRRSNRCAPMTEDSGRRRQRDDIRGRGRRGGGCFRPAVAAESSGIFSDEPLGCATEVSACW